MTWLTQLAVALFNAAVNKFVSWYSTLRAGRAEAVADAARQREAEEAKAREAGERARKDHISKADDSAFDQDFRRDR